MTGFLQATANGIAVGAIYALLALGFVIIYKSTQVLSFAQQGLTVLGAFWVVYFSDVLDLSFWVAVSLGMLLAAAVGIVIERIMLRPMVGKPVFAVALLTIGLNIVILVIAFDLIGVEIRSLRDPWGFKSLSIGGVTISYKNAATIITAVVVVSALLAFFRYAKFGLAMRATASDQEVALAQGVTVTHVFAAAWALAAVAGVFLGAGTGVAPAIGARAIRALPAAVVGGLDSIAGAIVGGLIIGLVEAYTVAYQSQYLSFLGANFANVVAWVVMFLVLLVRPSGLFGTIEVERV